MEASEWQSYDVQSCSMMARSGLIEAA